MKTGKVGKIVIGYILIEKIITKKKTRIKLLLEAETLTTTILGLLVLDTIRKVAIFQLKTFVIIGQIVVIILKAGTSIDIFHHQVIMLVPVLG